MKTISRCKGWLVCHRDGKPLDSFPLPMRTKKEALADLRDCESHGQKNLTIRRVEIRITEPTPAGGDKGRH